MVERRNVVMGPKGKGRICPPWSAEGVRIRVVPCNTAPCPASCVESSLATDSEELVQKANSEFRIFTGIPPAGVSVLPEAKEIDEGSAEQGNEDSKGNGSEVNTAKEDNEKDKDEEEEDKETEDSHDKGNSEVKENGNQKEENNEKDKEEEDKEKEDSKEKESSNETDDDSEEAGQVAGEDNEDSEASTHSFAAFPNLRQSVHIHTYNIYIYIRIHTY